MPPGYHAWTPWNNLFCGRKLPREYTPGRGIQGKSHPTRILGFWRVMEEVRVKPELISSENFHPFGQLATSFGDGDKYGPHDVQLNLSNGIPRFYIMQLKRTGLRFKGITHHANVTQCLGSIGAHPWYMAVAVPSKSTPETEGAVKSKSGHYYVPPAVESVKVFRIEGPCFIKLHEGTWHAGPLFEDERMDFYNLELSDTNIVDHTTHVFEKRFILDA